ncbi:hypothetical protein GGS24DRAFT_467261 [Hypoxylon argillaceum]|nr:hypothetical protein GGS24DRAFT_467261 [Hypoxylon argillaceum]
MRLPNGALLVLSVHGTLYYTFHILQFRSQVPGSAIFEPGSGRQLPLTTGVRPDLNGPFSCHRYDEHDYLGGTWCRQSPLGLSSS